jgi:hypothetical protein
MPLAKQLCSLQVKLNRVPGGQYIAASDCPGGLRYRSGCGKHIRSSRGTRGERCQSTAFVIVCWELIFDKGRPRPTAQRPFEAYDLTIRKISASSPLAVHCFAPDEHPSSKQQDSGRPYEPRAQIRW